MEHPAFSLGGWVEGRMFPHASETTIAGDPINHLLIRHKVADFAAWKPGYDAHLPGREAAGLKEVKLLRTAEDPNEIVALFEVADVARAKALCASVDLGDRMKELGVVGEPNIAFLTD